MIVGIQVLAFYIGDAVFKKIPTCRPEQANTASAGTSVTFAKQHQGFFGVCAVPATSYVTSFGLRE